MEDFPSNSKHPKAVASPKSNDKKIEKVVTGDVIQRKKSFGKRMAETFIAASPSAVATTVFWELFIPRVKDMAIDMGQEYIASIFGGESVHRRRVGRPSPLGSPGYSPRVKYGEQYRSKSESIRELSRGARATHNFDEIVLETRVEAEAVLDQMFEILSKYDVVRLPDLYSMLGITSDYTDEKYGWTSLQGAKPIKIREGYLLDLPRPEPLK